MADPTITRPAAATPATSVQPGAAGSGAPAAGKPAAPARPGAEAGPAEVATAVVASPIGPVSVRAGGGVVLRVKMGDEDAVADAEPGSLAALAAAELAEYFAGTRESFTVVPDWDRLGDEAARALRELGRIAPYGHTVSYGELATAADIQDVLPARVAGQILNANPWPILVPCHRVIMSDGSIGGFGGAVWRKEILLRHEGVLPATLF